MLTEGMHVRYDDMVSEKDARHTAMNVCINEQSYFPNFVVSSAEGTEKGILKSWDEARGFGFIQPDAGGPELYVGRSVVDVYTQSIIKDDLPVTYDTAGQGEHKFVLPVHDDQETISELCTSMFSNWMSAHITRTE